MNDTAPVENAGKSVTFSVITATYNAAAVLPRLIASLKAQTDQDFEWIVADGASTDDTLRQVKEVQASSPGFRVRVNSRPDFGIYDALNRAVKMASGEYYLIMGADDELFPDAVANYRRACAESAADLVTAKVEVDGVVRGIRRPRWEWLYGQFAYISAHAVGLAIRTSLHNKFGLYSRRFVIAADKLFILTAAHGGASLYQARFIAGQFYVNGASGNDVFASLTEGARVMVSVGHSLELQWLLLTARLVRHHRKIHKQRLVAR